MAQSVTAIGEGTRLGEPHRRLLAQQPALQALGGSALEALAQTMSVKYVPANTVLCTEGEAPDRLSLVFEGRAEASALQAGKPLPLWSIVPGEIFGEEALSSPGTPAQYTVTAAVALTVLTLRRGDFEELADNHQDLRPAFDLIADSLQVMKFLKMATPFGALSVEQLRVLASRVGRVCVPAGQDVVRQGEPGGSCYLLRSGLAEVWLQQGESAARKLATLRSGTLFGERALLTGQPRNATVRAAANSELLVLTRDHLRGALGEAHGVGLELLQLLQMRDRPCRVEGIEAHHGMQADGSEFVILKNRRDHTYYRLSPEGWFLWERMDGNHTVRDLMMDYLGAYKAFAPEIVAQVAGGLAAAGFVHANPLHADMQSAAFRLNALQRALIAARRLLEWRVALKNVDGAVTWLYDNGVRMLYTVPAQIMLTIITVVGSAGFLLASPRAVTALHSPAGAHLLWFLVPAYLFGIAVHEAGHAFTVKAFGREVARVGVGWYWFGPIAFVDTSDMWLAGKRARILVSLAGPYTNAILGGAAGLASCFARSPMVVAALWQFALLSYITVLVNLNPLMEYDGYFLLMDWLDRANLRSSALRWLGTGLPRAIRSRTSVRGHRFEILYGIGSVVYIAFMAIATLVVYRSVVQTWVAHLLAPALASALAWLLVALITGLSVLTVAGDLRGARRT